MKILSVECSAKPASVAIIENGKILASSFTNISITHSQTLMPMIENLLKTSMISVNDIDGFSVASGPGSFTGIRIGISCIKGLSISENKPCVGVSTLLAMAHNFIDFDVYLCPVMDARCNQFYNALFKIEKGKITRLCEDRCLMGDEIIREIENLGQNVVICGDGAELFYNSYKNDNLILAHNKNRYQSAIGVALATESDFIHGRTVSSSELLPIYLRLPQAQRELNAKKNK